MSYLDRLDAPGPKRLLALDGGGIRGVITLEVLDRLQSDLRDATGDDGLVLADVFDYIGGTSTGAIIAAGLALGMPTDQLLALYVERGAEMFDRARLLDRVRHTYDEEPLEAILQSEFGPDTTFGSERLQSLLLVVLRNATTDSPWPLSNNPRASFNERTLAGCNLDLPLWQLVRASTAAPVYFAPEAITVGNQQFVFVDGAITPFNNPAFQLFTMATLDAYGLGWATGEDDLLLVSVGTGSSEFARPDLQTDDMHLLHHATTVPAALMTSVARQQDALCRMFGRCRWGLPLDAEVGDLRSGAGLLDQRLFSYVRYDVPLDPSVLADLDLGDIRIGDVMAIDSVDHIEDLRRIGRAVADVTVDLDHVAGFLPEGMVTSSRSRPPR